MSKPHAIPKRRRVAVTPTRELFQELAEGGRLRTVAVERVRASDRQPRTRFDDDELAALAKSIEHRGLLSPIVVRPADTDGIYALIAGERRVRAVRQLGWDQIEALIKDVDDQGALEDAVLENVARVDLSPIEKARVYATMVEDFGLTREAVGERVGESRMTVSNHLRLLGLPDEALALIDEGRLTFAHGRLLLMASDHTIRRRLALEAARGDWSTRQLEAAVRAVDARRVRRPRSISADHQTLARQIGDAITAAGVEQIKVKAGARETFTFTVTGAQAARTLAQRLGARDLGDL